MTTVLPASVIPQANPASFTGPMRPSEDSDAFAAELSRTTQQASDRAEAIADGSDAASDGADRPIDADGVAQSSEAAAPVASPKGRGMKSADDAGGDVNVDDAGLENDSDGAVTAVVTALPVMTVPAPATDTASAPVTAEASAVTEVAVTVEAVGIPSASSAAAPSAAVGGTEPAVVDVEQPLTQASAPAPASAHSTQGASLHAEVGGSTVLVDSNEPFDSTAPMPQPVSAATSTLGEPGPVATLARPSAAAAASATPVVAVEASDSAESASATPAPASAVPNMPVEVGSDDVLPRAAGPLLTEASGTTTASSAVTASGAVVPPVKADGDQTVDQASATPESRRSPMSASSPDGDATTPAVDPRPEAAVAPGPRAAAPGGQANDTQDGAGVPSVSQRAPSAVNAEPVRARAVESDPATPADARVAVPASAGPIAATPASPPMSPAAPAHLHPPVAQQVAAHITAFRGRADGSYNTTLHLAPEDLGEVTIRLQIHGGNVSLHAIGGSVAAVDALRDAMPDLRQDLQRSGLDLVDSQIDQRAGSQAGDAQRERDSVPAGQQSAGPAIRTAAVPQAAAGTSAIGIMEGGRVDVRV